MSKENKQEELKYFERLNIPVLSISKIKDLIKTNIRNTIECWNKSLEVEKQAFHIIGPAGIGKSQICFQLTKELTEELKKEFKTLMVKCPVLSRDDFLIPFPIIDNGNTSFKMLYSDFVPMDKDSFGIFVIDEFSRGDHSLQQLMWQIQNDCHIHLHHFPKGWFVIAIDNPDDQEYAMDNLEDAAGLRRMLHLYVEVSSHDFLSHALSNNFHPAIIEFITTHPNFLYDFKAQKMGSVYANPASYEKLSNILWGFEKTSSIHNNYNKIESLASGLLNVSMSKLFIEFLEGMKIITPMDIFNRYDKVRPRVLALIKSNDNARMSELMTSFITYLSTSMPKFKKKELDNIVQFLLDCPVDTAAVYFTSIDKFRDKSEVFKYFTDIHVELVKRKDYREGFYEKMVDLGESKKIK